MTLAELLAGIQASQSAGFGATGADLSVTAESERRALQDARRQLQEQEKARGRSAKRREQRRGIGRTIGTGLGLLLALPTGGLSLGAGAALGSALGQTAATAGQRVRGVESGLGSGMFFRGAREDVSSAQRDINRYISDANKGFANQIIASSIGDYFLGQQLGQLAGTAKYATAAEGFGRKKAAKDMLLDFRNLLYKSPGTGGQGLMDLDSRFNLTMPRTGV
mgnify:CR=1 FL=1|jgi:alkanesulfonate monooxygenase SsuD/methylene tetrahydromethanopterin reductase-like flavin-dependent oxidoreductase (luciferase family)|tara:strand:+ start:2105 stop:2770 length:666 start_codon:yes stop_codon:yes gene_type:complete